MNFYDYTIFPIECVYKAAYLFFYNYVHDYGIALLCLSLFTYCITHPLQNWAAKLQHTEKELQEVLSAQIARIKFQYDGVDRHNALKRLYRRYNYHPIMAVRSAIGVGMQIPFLMAAFYMLSELQDLDGVKWLFLENLKEPDRLFYGINVMPFVMTMVNIFSAVTTEGFSRKDIKQAGVVALVFLVLLYDAPSALLVYWTTNNLLSLGTNILQKTFGNKLYRIEKYTGGIFNKLIKAEYKAYLAIILSFIWTIGFWVPLDIFFRNTEEFWFGINDIFHWLILINVVMSIIAIVIVRLIKTKNIMNVAGYVFFFLLVDVCIQSYMLNVSYGVLDGRSIDWGSYGSYGLYNALLWAGIIFVPLLLLFRFNLQQIVSCCAKVSVMLLIMQGAGLLYYVTSADCIRARHECAIVTTKGLLDFSKDENIIVIILDTFDSSYMQELLNSDYGDTVRSTFEGFTYYPDTVGMYPTTKGAVPYIMTGELYKNDVPYNEYIKNAYHNNSLYTKLLNEKYIIEGYSFPVFYSTDNPVFSNVEYGFYQICDKENFFVDFYKLSMFRIMPHTLKQYLVSVTDDFDLYKSYEERQLYSWKNDTFYERLKEEKIRVSEISKRFKIYHLKGAHPPYEYDENFKSDSGVKYTSIDATKANCTLVKEFFEQLKNNNIFDASTIIVLADHGNINLWQNPLFLIKNKNEKHKLKVSDKQFSYSMLQQPFLGILDGKVIKENVIGVQDREFYYYNWDDSWDAKFLPVIKIFKCTGNASDLNSFQYTGIKYGVFDNNYALGDEIDFSVVDNNKKYLLYGFSWAENWGTWSCARKSILEFSVGDVNYDLKFDLDYLIFNGSQRIKIVINGEEIADYVANKEEEKVFIIPKYLVRNGVIVISLDLPDAKSPKSLGLSEDIRELAIGIKKIRISEVK